MTRGESPPTWDRSAPLSASPEIFDQHQVGAATHKPSEQDRLAIRRHGEARTHGIGWEILQPAEQPITATRHINRVQRRIGARLACAYTTACPAVAKAAGLTQSTSGCGVPSPVSGITINGESPNFG